LSSVVGLVPSALLLRVLAECYFFSSRIPRPPSSTLFPYTTLFRSEPRLIEAEANRARSKPTENLDAYDCVLRALSLLYSFKESEDRKSTRLNSSHVAISYAVFCLKKKNVQPLQPTHADPAEYNAPG